VRKRGILVCTTRVFRDGRSYVAHALELDVSSCGGGEARALRNLKEAVRLFLETAGCMGTMELILAEAGYGKYDGTSDSPEFVCLP
jgi:hypothetical protein